jgi:hypothetical protein
MSTIRFAQIEGRDNFKIINRMAQLVHVPGWGWLTEGQAWAAREHDKCQSAKMLALLRNDDKRHQVMAHALIELGNLLHEAGY